MGILIVPLSTAFEYLEEQYNSVPFFRKTVIFNERSSIIKDPYQLLLYRTFFTIIQFNNYGIGWDLLQLNAFNDKFIVGKNEYELVDGMLLKQTFSVALLNSLLPPIVIAKGDTVNRLGLPEYLPVNQISISPNPPKCIVYLGTDHTITKKYQQVLMV